MNQRMKWDAEAAFKRIDEQMGYSPSWEARSDVALMKTTPYTPPPNVAAWLQAQADKPKGRDYDAILRAAKKAPVGYYEDAPTGIKFTGVGNGSCPKIDATASKQGVAPLAPTHPTPPHSADGGQPLPSASTKPHGKDVDTADGGTPLIGMFGQERLWFGGMEYTAHGRAMPCRRDAAMCWWQNTRTPTIPEMCSWLEQNGHADVAAQLRGKPRDDVATGGGRAWKNRAPRHFTETCYEHWRAVLIDGKVYTRGAWNKPGVWSGEANDVPSLQDFESGSYPELFGPERDAIVAECRKAMGL